MKTLKYGAAIGAMLITSIRPSFAQHLNGKTAWSPWATNGTIGFANNGVPFQWLGSPSGSVNFSPAAWNGAGGWNLRVFAEIASGQSSGIPPACQSRPFDNGTRLAVQFRVPVNELNAPGVLRPSTVQVLLSNAGGTAPTLWRNITLVHYSGSQTLFEYRQCFSTPIPGANGEWGKDGSLTSCQTHGPSGVAQFQFTASPTVNKQALGGPSGFVLGPADISITSSVYGDVISFTLGGAAGGSNAYLLYSNHNIPGGYTYNYYGTLLTLYIASALIAGPFPIDAQGRANTPPIAVSPAFASTPLYFQWIGVRQNVIPYGLSEGIQAIITYDCK